MVDTACPYVAMPDAAAQQQAYSWLMLMCGACGCPTHGVHTPAESTASAHVMINRLFSPLS